MDKFDDKFWLDWCMQLWNDAERAWLNRNGQDHFYREFVTIPALVKEVQNLKSVKTIVDLGCGDGYPLQLFLEHTKGMFNHKRNVVIVDRSKTLLEYAKSSLAEKGIKTTAIEQELDSPELYTQISAFPGPKLMLSLFVLNEMVCISNLFLKLADQLEPLDRIIAIVVHPDFAKELLSDNTYKLRANSASENLFSCKEFQWASSYPISTNDESFYLPYFHRTINDYELQLCSAGLKLVHSLELCVPETKEAHEYYDNSDYGSSIINTPSSLLLFIEKA